MTRLRDVTILALAAIALGPTPMRAQAARPAVTALSVGQRVRVQAPGIVVEGGTVSEIDDETLYVLEEGQEWLVDINSIERLEVERHPVMKNVLTFALVGGLAGVAAHEFRESFSARRFLVGGAAFGLLFGLTQREWRVTFPR